MFCGNQAPTMPELQRKWLLNAKWRLKAKHATITAAKNSLKKFGNGKPNLVVRLPSNCAVWARRVIGRANVLPWMKA